MPIAVRILLRMRFVGMGIRTIVCLFVRVEDTEVEAQSLRSNSSGAGGIGLAFGSSFGFASGLAFAVPASELLALALCSFSGSDGRFRR